MSDQPVIPSDRITEAELLLAESNTGQAPLIAARLGRKLVREFGDEFDVEVTAKILEPFVGSRLMHEAKLVAEIRRFRAMLIRLYGADE